MSFLTDEQAAYLSQLYTGTDVPKLHKAPTMYVHDLEQRYAERGHRIQYLERLIHERKEQVEDLNHKLFEAMCDRNRAYNRIKELEDRLTETKKDVETVDCCRIHAEIEGYERGKTIHRLERRLHKANRKYAALHRAMRDDTERVRGSLIKAAERLAQSIITPSTVEWPRFEDREPVLIGNWIAAEMGPFKVGSILFCDGHVLIYDEQHFHYVKLRDGEFAEHDPYGRR
jgi:prepilin-type processing-associated H-X9-DG protein